MSIALVHAIRREGRAVSAQTSVLVGKNLMQGDLLSTQRTTSRLACTPRAGQFQQPARPAARDEAGAFLKAYWGM